MPDFVSVCVRVCDKYFFFTDGKKKEAWAYNGRDTTTFT